MLILFSLSIIGFCLSLYFQTQEQLITMRYDQFKNLEYSEDRSHSLKEFNSKISPYKLEEIVADIVEQNHLKGEKTRIMEIGSGNGRVLMELKRLFPNVEFYGVNKEKTHTFYRRESFILTALKFNIFSEKEIQEIDLPYIIFEDLDHGGKIPYEDGKFDLVFSQHTLPWIKYKFELFNEIMRILKPSGTSLHTEAVDINIYSKGIILDIKDAFGEMRRKGIHIKTLENSQALIFKKNKEKSIFPLLPQFPIQKNQNYLGQEHRPQMVYTLI